jgi:ribosomal protein S18 acetylase RimI-like enzyme
MTREERRKKNRLEKRELVRRGRSHGILVYSNSEPVGWCQYGPKEELPRNRFRRYYRKLALPNSKERKLWRITCFFVDRKHRRRGVAQAALRAALESIKNKGGGMVEAYPTTPWQASKNWSFGTVGMFEREKFKKVAALGIGNLVMRKIV